MSVIEYLAAIQAIGDQGRSNNSASTEIAVIALFAVLLGLMVFVVIRTSSKRSNRH